MTRVAVMGGDGIGPEVVGATMRILEQMELDLEFVKAHMGLNCYGERASTYRPRPCGRSKAPRPCSSVP
ncbi:MAG: isocitrate/isopropylmalate family dehydrogenase [Chromatiales bacterium]|nr:isocitrate/isopropylmalate family dehydrogenase [Chromatiales bacterium]